MKVAKVVREKKKVSHNYNFVVLKEGDIDETSELIARIFPKYDPFLTLFKLDPKDLAATIKETLAKVIDSEGAIIVRHKKTNKIVGVYSSMLFSLFDLPKSDKIKQGETFVIDLDKLDKMSYSEKLEVLDTVDQYLTKPSYDMYKEKGMLDKVTFGDYWCVEEEFFNTDLAQSLASVYYMHLYKKGIQYLLGTYFNPRAYYVSSKLMNMNAQNTLKVHFLKDGKIFKEFELIFINIYREDFKPKF